MNNQSSDNSSHGSDNSSITQEVWFPSLVYVGAATIASAALVSNSKSMKIKLLTPFVVAGATAIYFIPTQAKQVQKVLYAKTTYDPRVPPVYTLKPDPQGAVSGVGIGLGNGIMGRNNGRMTTIRDSLPTNPSSSQWSWWKNTDTGSIATGLFSSRKKADTELDMKMNSKPEILRPKNVVVDKAVATAAIKGHDDLINKASMAGKNVEETALKVHDNVVNAALPGRRQSRHEMHPVEISRQASQSNLKDGKFVIRVTENTENPHYPQVLPERVRRGSDAKKESHGLENLEKRASMIYKGVEHIEHNLNKQIERTLQEEADYWHQQSLSGEPQSRGGERGM